MHGFTRRQGLKIGVGVGALAAGGLLGASGARAAIGDPNVKLEFKPEPGASLRVARPTKFVQGDETQFLANVAAFKAKYGIDVRVDFEGWEDLRPKTAVAANVGTGPDIILVWNEDPFLYPGKTLVLNDLTDYLGKKYGGWFKIAETYGRNEKGDWVAMPFGGSGGTMVYREKWVREAGFEKFPTDFPGYLELCRALKKTGHPCGLALGNAVGDAWWTDWVLWGFGSSLIDENSKISIENPQTLAALDYAKALYETFIPGTLSWLDPSNNKAFLAGEIALTTNGISIYYAAKTSQEPAVAALAADIQHGLYPVGPVGFGTQSATVINAMAMAYTKYPNAAKEFMRFMMEAEQYVPWQEASIGYWCHPLAAYDANPIWASDPKIAAYKGVTRQALPGSYKGRPSEAASAAKAEFLTVNMFQSVCAGQQSPKDAMAEAARRAKRFFSA